MALKCFPVQERMKSWWVSGSCSLIDCPSMSFFQRFFISHLVDLVFLFSFISLSTSKAPLKVAERYKLLRSVSSVACAKVKNHMCPFRQICYIKSASNPCCMLLPEIRQGSVCLSLSKNTKHSALQKISTECISTGAMSLQQHSIWKSLTRVNIVF